MKKHLIVWGCLWIAISLMFASLIEATSDDNTPVFFGTAIMVVLIAIVWYLIRWIYSFNIVKTILGKTVIAVTVGFFSSLILSAMGVEGGASLGGVLAFAGTAIAGITGNSDA